MSILKVLKARLLEEYFQNQLYEFKNFRLLKHMRVFQLIFYMFGVSRDRVVIPRTNKVDWKRAKRNISEGFMTYIKYCNPVGPKPVKIFPYAMTKYLITEAEKLNEDEIKHYSFTIYLLLKFVKLFLSIRIADVTKRRNRYLAKKEERD